MIAVCQGRLPLRDRPPYGVLDRQLRKRICRGDFVSIARFLDLGWAPVKASKQTLEDSRIWARWLDVDGRAAEA